MYAIDVMIYEWCLWTLAILVFQKLKMSFIVVLLLKLEAKIEAIKLLQNINLTGKSAAL